MGSNELNMMLLNNMQYALSLQIFMFFLKEPTENRQIAAHYLAESADQHASSLDPAAPSFAPRTSS